MADEKPPTHEDAEHELMIASLAILFGDLLKELREANLIKPEGLLRRVEGLEKVICKRFPADAEGPMSLLRSIRQRLEDSNG